MRDKIYILIVGTEESSQRLADLFKGKGDFIPIKFPVIKTIPLEVDKSLNEILNFDGYIFGSKRAVDYFFKFYPIENFRNKLFIAVGKKTKEKLESLGLNNVLYPEKDFSSKGVLDLIKNNWDKFKDKKLLFPKSAIGVDTLEKNLPNVYPLPIYTTIPFKPHNLDTVETLLQNGDIKFIVFFSPSSFKAFKDIFSEKWRDYLKNSIVISIGKTTGKELEKNGITDFLLPEKSTSEYIHNLIIKRAGYL